MSHAGSDGRYEIREVDGSDAAVALDLETLHALTFWKDAPPIDPESGHWWIARLGKKPIGFAGMSESRIYPHVGYFSRVGVVAAHRGHGLQLRFLRAAEARARRNGWSGITADTRDARSANNFAKAGYQIFDPERRWAYPDSIYWRKDLRRRRREPLIERQDPPRQSPAD